MMILIALYCPPMQQIRYRGLFRRLKSRLGLPSLKSVMVPWDQSDKLAERTFHELEKWLETFLEGA